MTEDQQKATLEAGEVLHQITTALQGACIQVSQNGPAENTPEAMAHFCEGLRALLNAAHNQIGRANADMAEALYRANPAPTTLN